MIAKFSFFIILVFIYLGFSKAFSPIEVRTLYIPSPQVLPHYFQSSPISLLLLKSFTGGLFVKTYYKKIKVITPFGPTEIITIRVPKDFWFEFKSEQGMTIFNRLDDELGYTLLSLPPGSIFVGNQSFGRWLRDPSGDLFWHFHRSYRNFPNLFYWGEWRPSFNFYEELQLHMKNSQNYYGPRQEFGRNGSLTAKNLAPLYTKSKSIEDNKLDIVVSKLFHFPPPI